MKARNPVCGSNVASAKCAPVGSLSDAGCGTYDAVSDSGDRDTKSSENCKAAKKFKSWDAA